MNVTESAINETIKSHLSGAAREGADLVRVDLRDEPLKIVATLNTFVADPPKKRWFRRVDNWTDRALPLGCLWADQLKRQFGWEWIEVVQHDYNDSKLTAVFDAERSLGVYPFHYIFGCLENGVTPTILLAFNMLVAGTVPRFEPHAYINLMDGVRHIVPPA